MKGFHSKKIGRTDAANRFSSRDVALAEHRRKLLKKLTHKELPMLEKNNGKTPSIYAGKTVMITDGELKGQRFKIEDWQPRAMGKPWGQCSGNPAALEYAMRAGKEAVPPDHHCYYGKIDGLGKIMHASQLGEIEE